VRSRWLFVGAALPILLFVLLHVAGGRGAVSLLSGTLPPDELTLLLGLGYALSWFVLVLATPILALAGGLSALVDALLRRRRRVAAADGHALPGGRGVASAP